MVQKEIMGCYEEHQRAISTLENFTLLLFLFILIT